MARRIRIYLFGVGLGCIMVYFTLIQGRERELAGWLPNYRILEQLSTAELIIDEQGQCYLDCFQLDTNAVNMATKDGDVIITQSKPRQEPKLYVVKSKQGKQEIRFYFASTKKSTTLRAIRVMDEPNCDC